MRMQATVGAGLPIISTLQTLLETGDSVQQIEGVFSGTLSYIFNRCRHRPFSLLRTAACTAGASHCCSCLIFRWPALTSAGQVEAASLPASTLCLQLWDSQGIFPSGG